MTLWEPEEASSPGRHHPGMVGEIISECWATSSGIRNNSGMKGFQAVRRVVGMVFQQFNPFPRLTVVDNCTLALIRARNMAGDVAEEIAMQNLQRVRIPEQARKYPTQLSGGQQQRVAIARVNVLEQQQPHDEAGLDSRPIMLAVKRIDVAGELNQFVPNVDDLAQPRPEQALDPWFCASSAASSPLMRNSHGPSQNRSRTEIASLAR